MSYPELIRGDKGDDVKRLQSLLNRVGAMLLVDGDFGVGTERGVRYAQDIAGQPKTGTADTSLWYWTEQQPIPFEFLATNGVALIAKEETGGLGYYDAVTRWPHYPGLSSGVTIGVGYDLRFNSEQDFHRCWGPHLPAETMEALAQDIGKAGTKRRVDELKRAGVEVPFRAAWPVFLEETLPRFYRMTESIYPSLPRLPDLCRSVLVSIVYNRGNSLSGSSRREMRVIRDLLALADDIRLHKLKRKVILADVEEQIISMQRLWGPATGLHRRRQAEANLWREGIENW